MFSHLCRACLAQFNDPSDIVPLFEPYGNVYFYRICNELKLLVQPNDQLGRNVCKSCAENIMKFYNFALTYRRSDKRLRDMLKNATKTVDEIVEFTPNIIKLEDQQRVHVNCSIIESTELIKKEVDDIDTKQFAPKASVPDPIVVARNHVAKRSPIKILTSKMQQQCTVCIRKFDSRKSLEKHMREQHLSRPTVQGKSDASATNEYECDVCSKRFLTKNKIRQHLITHINEGRRKFLCVACGNQFCSKFGLAQHISAIHDREQKFLCTKCNRRFAHKHNLKTHMNRHDGIRPYACTVCTKSFYDSSTLNVHTKSVHSHANAYICSICSKGFNRNGNLKIHMVKTHHIQHPKLQSTSSIQRVIMKVE